MNSLLVAKSFILTHGKFYDCIKGKSVEVIPDSLLLDQSESGTLCTCGRSSATYGTEGTLKLFDKTTLIGTFGWMVGYISSN
jgi:hypothetical protein